MYTSFSGRHKQGLYNTMFPSYFLPGSIGIITNTAELDIFWQSSIATSYYRWFIAGHFGHLSSSCRTFCLAQLGASEFSNEQKRIRTQLFYACPGIRCGYGSSAAVSQTAMNNKYVSARYTQMFVVYIFHIWYKYAMPAQQCTQKKYLRINSHKYNEFS